MIGSLPQIGTWVRFWLDDGGDGIEGTGLVVERLEDEEGRSYLLEGVTVACEERRDSSGQFWVLERELVQVAPQEAAAR